MSRTRRLIGQKTIGGKYPHKAAVKTKSAVPKRRYRYKPGSKSINIKISINTNISTAKALMEIRKYQKSVNMLIPLAPFARLVKEIMGDIFFGSGFRIQSSAMKALQESAESMLVAEFESKLINFSINLYTNLFYIVTNLAAIHAKRITIQVKDMLLVQAMRKGMLGYSKPGER